jgi:uncharacterized membrane protein YphA (DoxX/SURF4 family)
MSGAVILLLASVFLLAAIAKLRSREAFSKVLRQFMPRALAETLSRVVPIGEIVLAAFLISGIWSRAALVASVAVLGCFTLVLGRLWQRGLKGCACFGETENDLTPGAGIVRNLLLIAAALEGMGRADPIALVGPDVSSFLARLTIVAGAFCLWSCLVPLIQRRKFLFNLKRL